MKKFIILILIVSFTPIFAQQIQFDSGEDSFTDGPYIFWEGNDVTIEYISDGSIVNQKYQNKTGKFLIALAGFEHEFEITSYPYLPPSSEYNGVTKFFALSDVHGQFDRFVEILQESNIINSKNNWNWGNGHLIINGDVFDRGEHVTESLWLIHKLERQAEEQNGQVHFLLGNHEIMVLQNDLRYVNDKYKKVVSPKLEKTYSEMYSNNSELGKWLRSKNTIMKINNILFVHAGIHPEFVKDLPLDRYNQIIRDNVDASKNEIKNNSLLSDLFGSIGPFWYRGYFQNSNKYKQIKQKELLNLINKLDVSNIIVGHTTQDFINPFFKNTIIPIDTGIKYGDSGEALLWENQQFYRVKANGYKEQLIFNQ